VNFPIEAKAKSPYSARMLSAFLRLLALVAVMLMPFGMSAAATATVHHPQMDAMSMQHCPDQNSKPHSKSLLAECTMACAAALPALDTPVAERMSVAHEPAQALLVQGLHGLHPETATPPPKDS
jgi:hypothetical protein